MLAEMFLTAVITCSTGQATCSSYEMDDHTRVEVCGILTESSEGRVSPDAVRQFSATLDGEQYVVTIRPFCKVY
jgi:hypothetical protein